MRFLKGLVGSVVGWMKNMNLKGNKEVVSYQEIGDIGKGWDECDGEVRGWESLVWSGLRFDQIEFVKKKSIATTTPSSCNQNSSSHSSIQTNPFPPRPHIHPTRLTTLYPTLPIPSTPPSQLNQPNNQPQKSPSHPQCSSHFLLCGTGPREKCHYPPHPNSTNHNNQPN